MKKKAKTTFSVSQASDITCVSKNKIRDWHSRGYLEGVSWITVGARRHRRFSERDIEAIKKIAEFQRQGFTLPVAVEKAKQEIRPH